MKLLIRSHKRASTHTTMHNFSQRGDERGHFADGSRDIPGLKCIIVVNDQREMDEYLLAKPHIVEGRICHASLKGEPGDHIRVLNWMLDNLCEPDEWVLFADDNLRKLWVADESICGLENAADIPGWPSRKAQRMLETYVDAKTFLDHVRTGLSKADRIGARLYGTSTTSNAMFRKQHWRDVGFVQHKFFGMRPTPKTRYDLGVMVRDEHYMTALHHWEFGCVMIDNWLHAKRTHYQPGGIGTLESRLPGYVRDTAYLMNQWPGFFVPVTSKGSRGNVYAPDSEIRMRFCYRWQVNQWRSGIQEELSLW